MLWSPLCERGEGTEGKVHVCGTYGTDGDRRFTRFKHGSTWFDMVHRAVRTGTIRSALWKSAMSISYLHIISKPLRLQISLTPKGGGRE
jgi:hypothetical protein